MSFKMPRTLSKLRLGSRAAPSRSPLDEGLGFTIRFAYPDDDAALRHLAALDSQPLAPGPLLVAEVDGELWAAMSITGEPRAIADPYHHTVALVALLREHADRLTRRGRHRAAPQHPMVTVACSSPRC
jgi:hypothetical protein